MQPGDTDRVKTNYLRLQALGHTVSLVETTETDGALTYSITHYLTCKQCLADRGKSDPSRPVKP